MYQKIPRLIVVSLLLSLLLLSLVHSPSALASKIIPKVHDDHNDKPKHHHDDDDSNKKNDHHPSHSPSSNNNNKKEKEKDRFLHFNSENIHKEMHPTAAAEGGKVFSFPPDSEDEIQRWKNRLGYQLLTRNHKSSRVVAIGDLHGDIDASKEIFRLAQVTNDHGHWNSGTDTVIQIGDVLDRGPHGFLIMDFLQRLKEEAKMAGGELIQLLGNHELLNYFGDFRFVHPKLVESVGGIQKYASLVQKGGKYGEIIQRLPVGVIRNGTLFVHAGLTEINVRQYGSIDDINAIMRRVLFDQDRGHPIVGEHGPVWTRQNVYSALAQHACTTTEVALRSMSVLEQHLINLKDIPENQNVGGGGAIKPKVLRLVVGHTIMTEGEPRTFCNGMLFAIDVEMSAYMPGGGYLAYYEQLQQGVDGVQPITLFTLPRGTWLGHPPLWYPGPNGSLPEGYREHADGNFGHSFSDKERNSLPDRNILAGRDHHNYFAPDDEDVKDRVRMVAVKNNHRRGGSGGEGSLFRGTFLMPLLVIVTIIVVAIMWMMKKKGQQKRFGSVA